MRLEELRDYVETQPAPGKDLPLVFMNTEGRSYVVNGAFMGNYNGTPVVFLTDAQMGNIDHAKGS